MKRLRRANSLDELAGRPPLEPSVFKKAIELEYAGLESAWKRCLEFEAGSTSLAATHMSSLALIKTSVPLSSSPSSQHTSPSVCEEVTIHDVEDLHKEIKVCLLQLGERHNQS